MLVAFGELPASLACQILCFRNQFDSLRHERITFETDADGIGYAETVVDDLISDHSLQVVQVVLKILVGDFDASFRNVLLEFTEKRIRNLERRVDRRILCKVIPNEGIDRDRKSVV